MKVKYILKKTGKEIQLGEKIVITEESEKYGYKTTIVYSIPLTIDNAESLKEIGIIDIIRINDKKDKQEKPVDFASTDINYYLDRVAKKCLLSRENLIQVFKLFSTSYKSVIFSILLKEIALTMEEKHQTPVKQTEPVYYISLTNGLIYPALYSSIRVKDYISMFRSVKEAEVALSILNNFHKDMFPFLYE